MEVIANQNLSETVLQMDNHHFENCTIRQCVLVFSGGDFGWTNCSFSNCQIRLVGAAQRTIQFLRYFGVIQQAAPATVESSGSSSVN